jgi:hypothetical protein
MTALQDAVAKPNRNNPPAHRHRARRRPVCLAALWCGLAPALFAQAPGKAASGARGILEGKPDLSGIWQALNTAAWDIQDHAGQLGIPPGQGVVEGNELPYQPWAAKKKEENAVQRETADPTRSNCFLPGVPRATYMPYPFEIVQTPARIAIRYEFAHALRTIPTDGSPHPDGLPDAWMGDSRGHWEGNTLVVDVRNFDERTWFDQAGNFHSDALHVIERYSLSDADHILYEATIEDPKVFTRPWKMRMPLYRIVDRNATLMEYECVFYLQEQRYKNAPFH